VVESKPTDVDGLVGFVPSEVLISSVCIEAPDDICDEIVAAVGEPDVVRIAELL